MEKFVPGNHTVVGNGNNKDPVARDTLHSLYKESEEKEKDNVFFLSQCYLIEIAL